MTRAYRCSVWVSFVDMTARAMLDKKSRANVRTTIRKNEKLSVLVYLKRSFQNLAIPIWPMSDVLGSYRQSNLESSRILSQSTGS